MEELERKPLLTDEERQALEEQAGSGELGEDMQTLVEKIRGGEDTWEQVFSGQSPHGALLQGHLARMVDEHQDDIALAFEELLEEEEAKGNFVLDDVPTCEELIDRIVIEAVAALRGAGRQVVDSLLS